MPGPPQQPGLYDAYVQPALSGLRRAAEGVGQAVGLTPDPNSQGVLGLRRAREQSRVQHAYDTVSRDMPGLQPVPVGIKMLPARVNAQTSDATGNITFNDKNLDWLSDPEIEELMAHELTHVRQVQSTPLLSRIYSSLFAPDVEVPPEAKGGSLDAPYYWRPDEMEAFQAQRDRMRTSGRLVPRDPMTGHADIYLPPEGRR